MTHDPDLRMAADHTCAHCGTPLVTSFVDLGVSPSANHYVQGLDFPEKFFPLHARVCHNCLLVQVGQFQSESELFSDYAYFSSFSSTWLEHAQRYVNMAVKKFGLSAKSRVIEIASNDGYLLQYFTQKNVQVLGIEPAENVAAVAQGKGVPTLVKFFGVKTAKELAKQGYEADLMIANNVLAHVPDINDFVAGFPIILKKNGTLTVEFPHLLRLIENTQFDTIYHEHFYYFSLMTVQRIFAHHGMTVYDVEELPTHGGSLRVYAGHTGAHKTTQAVQDILDKEKLFSLDRMDTYQSFAPNVHQVKRDLLKFLIDAKERGKRVIGYGAPAKGNTLLNFCGIRDDLMEFTVDMNPVKQGKYLPGVRIPIKPPEAMRDARPDYVVILPWNIADEVTHQWREVNEWGGKFVVAVPKLKVLGVGC